ncbi:MAG: flippase activity-associated protein Agl23 [Verrucomicrobiota bacterium]
MANLPPKLRWAIFIGIALLALAVRLPRLGERPMHTDEAVNAYITGQLLAGEDYHYDPQDRHGPALYFAALPIARTAGAKNLAELSEITVRLVPVIWGALAILLFAVVARATGFLTAAVAAGLWSIAPLPVYYSRYFIHETLFVTATLGFFLSGWRALETKSLGSAAMMGISAAFMLACKETAFLHFAALGAAGLAWIWIRRNDRTRRGLHWNAMGKSALVAFAAFIVLLRALYTWGGQPWQGPWDLLRSIPRFASRATGEGHEKPFWYYFQLLAGGWSGALLLGFALIGSIQAARTAILIFRRPLESPAPTLPNLALPILLIYTVAISLIYSVIPYKTPWLALNLFLPIAILAGAGFAWFWEILPKTPARLALLLVSFGLLAALGRDTWQWVFLKPSDEHNAYAYSHTGEDLLRLPERVRQLALSSQSKTAFRIAVIATDPWPLPWYLRTFPNVGFWQTNQSPGAADVYITSLNAAETFAPLLKSRRPEFFGVRPEVLILLWPSNPEVLAHE